MSFPLPFTVEGSRSLIFKISYILVVADCISGSVIYHVLLIPGFSVKEQVGREVRTDSHLLLWQEHFISGTMYFSSNHIRRLMMSIISFCHNRSVSLDMVNWSIHHNFPTALHLMVSAATDDYCLDSLFHEGCKRVKTNLIIPSVCSWQNLSITKNILLWIILIIWNSLYSKGKATIWFFSFVLFFILFILSFEAIIKPSSWLMYQKKVCTNQRSDIIQWENKRSRWELRDPQLAIAWHVVLGLYLWCFGYMQAICRLKKHL